MLVAWRMGVFTRDMRKAAEKRADEILQEAAARPVLSSTRSKPVVRSRDAQHNRVLAAAEARELEGGALEAAVETWAAEA